MWINAWLLVGSAALYQPTYPPFYTEADCESARLVYVRSRDSRSAQCIQAKVFVNGRQ